MIKVILGLAIAVLATVVAAKLAYEVTSYEGSVPINPPWEQNTMEFIAWNGEQWTAWIRDDAFVLRPENDSKWSPHANSSLAFLDWEGQPWQAKIDRDKILLAYRGEWKGHKERESAIRYRDWQGNKRLRTLEQLRR